jgi:hypothetical protein
MPMPSSRQAGRISPSIPRENQRVLDLQIADRVNGIGAPDRVGTDLGKADMADIACLHHVGDCADGVLDRHRRVKTGWAVDVDVLGIEPAE